MDRISREQVEDKAKLFARLMGKQYGTEPGNYWLDYIACYGGFNLVEITERTGERNPFGSRRRTAREMWYTLEFACEAVRLQQEKEGN